MSFPGTVNHCKVKPLQSDVAFSCLQRSGIKYSNSCFLSICNGNISLGHRTILQALEQYVDLKQYFTVQIQKNSYHCVIMKCTYKYLKYS